MNTTIVTTQVIIIHDTETDREVVGKFWAFDNFSTEEEAIDFADTYVGRLNTNSASRRRFQLRVVTRTIIRSYPDASDRVLG